MDGGRHRGLDLMLIGDVTVHGKRTAALLAQFRGGALGHVGVDVGDHDGRTFGTEGTGKGPAETDGPTRDECDVAVEPARHIVTLTRWSVSRPGTR